MYITLKPLGSGRDAAYQCRLGRRASSCRKLNGVPGIAVYIQNPPSIRIGGRGSKSFYQYTLQGPDIARSRDTSPQKLEARLKPPRVHGRDDRPADQESAGARVDRSRTQASKLGITATQIEKTLADAYGSSAGLDDLHRRPTNTGWCMESMPQYERDESALELSCTFRAPSVARWSRSRTIAHLQRAGRTARRSTTRDRCRRSRSRSTSSPTSRLGGGGHGRAAWRASIVPAEHHHGVLGTGAGVSEPRSRASWCSSCSRCS